MLRCLLVCTLESNSITLQRTRIFLIIMGVKASSDDIPLQRCPDIAIKVDTPKGLFSQTSRSLQTTDVAYRAWCVRYQRHTSADDPRHMPSIDFRNRRKQKAHRKHLALSLYLVCNLPQQAVSFLTDIHTLSFPQPFYSLLQTVALVAS